MMKMQLKDVDFSKSVNLSDKKTVKKDGNPYAPAIKIRNRQLTCSDDERYISVDDRVEPLLKNPDLLKAVDELKKRNNGEQYIQEHSGRLEYIPISKIVIDQNIQRSLEDEHIIKNIIPRFDLRYVQPINVVHLKDKDLYSCWDGQQTISTIRILIDLGVIESDYQVACKVVDDDLEVPGTTQIGEAVGNTGFTILNGKGKKQPDRFWLYRSGVVGVREYNSTLREDLQHERIQQVLEKNDVWPVPPVMMQGRQGEPGMVSHITSVESIAGFDTDKFDESLPDLDRTLHWHTCYFPDRPVDGGEVYALGRLYKAARKANIVITKKCEDLIAEMIKEYYYHPRGFHVESKDRIHAWQDKQGIARSWADKCLTPYLVLDLQEYCNEHNIKHPLLPVVDYLNIYAGT